MFSENKFRKPTLFQYTNFFLFCSLLLVLFVTGCKHKTKNRFSYNKLGYYFQLIAFNNHETVYKAGSMAWVDACFKTQSDSVFWDSGNNFNNNFFIKVDSNSKINFFQNYVSKLAVLDSACVLIKTTDFYLQQFNTKTVPFFSKNDSVVKVYFKLKEFFTEKQFITRKVNFLKEENEQIEQYFNSVLDFETARDSLGFYWIEKPTPLDSPFITDKNSIKLSYEGSYLNGRVFEKSPENFEISVGTPDQVIKGLNYVIKRLKKGQNAKIILPSRLAFGESGSSNGTIAPYTPLIYKLKIIDVKNE